LFLLEHGADQSLRGKEGLTPLESAEKYESREKVVLLTTSAAQGNPALAKTSKL
jgi:hypothetical protein